jgi:ATP-dependent DNA helicase RecG
MLKCNFVILPVASQGEGTGDDISGRPSIAKATNQQAQYIKNKGFDDGHYKNLIREYIKTFGKATRKEIDDLLLDKLPDVLSREQKMSKIKNLLSWLKRNEEIERVGSDKLGYWQKIVLNLELK